MLSLDSSITEIKGIGPKKAAAFEKMGLFKLEDLLWNFPRDYEDQRNIKTINSLHNEEKALVEASCMLIVKGRGYGRKRTLHLSVADKTGNMEVLFFMGGFMDKSFKIGQKYRFFGKVKVENSKVTMFHPAFSPADEISESGIIPVYPLTKGLTQKDIKKAVKEALGCMKDLQETLPESVIRSQNLCPIQYALSNVHFPEDGKSYSESRFRLVFEELFKLRTALCLSKERFGQGRAGSSFASGSSREFTEGLAYSLTGAQQRVIAEIEKDMDSPNAMNRLVQGDVGSGKTVVAQAALFKAVKAGAQGAFMAPTEILAAQHYENFLKDFAPYNINIEYLTGSVSGAEKKRILKAIEDGSCDLVIGTHAIISEGVKFKNLGLAVTDEQHRFGVNQRKKLSEKADNPDVLVMTATPIPRTLAVVLYSDLDVSVLDELPPGRKQIITEKFNENNRKEAYRKLISEVRNGRQGYIVCPFIEDSESIDGYSAEGLYSDFASQYPDIAAALLHGGMSQSEKDAIMQKFASGEISVLISTVVIEVGINVPNASVMLIENTERFGLAQLHQLRGRVGRGQYQSFCLLVLGEETEIAQERTDIMCNSSDGFYIAEKDLEIRGPGELFGYKQHGLPQLKLADPVKHIKIVEAASKAADSLLSDDPLLQKPENRYFGERIKEEFGSEVSLVL